MQRHSQKALLEEATARYEGQLGGSQAATYLDGRGIGETVARIARAGYVGTPHNGHEQFRGMLCLPYLSPAGVVGVKFRVLTESSNGVQSAPGDVPTAMPKYMGVPGARLGIYNVLAFQASEHRIAICEGELDALTLHHLCGVPAVGIPGAQSWRPHFARCFDGYDEVLVFADNDRKHDGQNPGRDLALKIMEAVPQARLIVLPPNVDVNDLYVSAGREAVLDLMK